MKLKFLISLRMLSKIQIIKIKNSGIKEQYFLAIKYRIRKENLDGTCQEYCKR